MYEVPNPPGKYEVPNHQECMLLVKVVNAPWFARQTVYLIRYAGQQRPIMVTSIGQVWVQLIHVYPTHI